MHLTASQNKGHGRDTPLKLLVKGFFVGAANLIPGVSGGTFALILGIFDRLIAALGHLNAGTAAAALGLVSGRFRTPARAAFAAEWRRTDLGFLALVAAGAAVSILALSTPLKWLLEVHPDLTLSFFAGLIIPSLAVPWGMMPSRGLRQLLWAAPGAALTVGIAMAFAGNEAAVASTGALSLVAAAVSGALAMSAMVLPGLSGSFIMLALGQYAVVLGNLEGVRALRLESILWLGAFGIGCAAGLLAFVRLLHWMLNRWRSAALAFLVGLVLGSFWLLWPFKDYGAGVVVEGRSGEVKREVLIASAPRRLPASGGELGRNAAALGAGLAGAWVIERLGKSSRANGSDEDSDRQSVEG